MMLKISIYNDPVGNGIGGSEPVVALLAEAHFSYEAGDRGGRVYSQVRKRRPEEQRRLIMSLPLC